MLLAVGRRLALQNTIVVMAVIALVGLTTLLLLRQSLEGAADRMLAERAMVGREQWAGRFAEAGPAAPGAPSSLVAEPVNGRDAFPESDDHDGDDEARELLVSGDILLFAVDPAGNVIGNARGLPVPGLPDAQSIALALAGETVARNGQVGGEQVRIYTEPVVIEGHVSGAVQAIRSRHELDEGLRLVALSTLLSIGLGAVIALPAGLYLARRALQPRQAALEQQRAFVADASHELRTPLTLMRATTELAQRLPSASPEVRDELDAVLQEIDTTNRLVSDLLLLASLDRVDLRLERQVEDLGEIVSEAVRAVVPLATRAGLDVSSETLPGLLVRVDAERIRQVLRILLSNAIAYTPAPGAVQVRVQRQGSRAIVRVHDTGIGVSEADRSRVFDRFYRGDPARARATGGTGLGLAIARELVIAHQGEIGLERPQGPGATFWFALPLAGAT